MIIAFIPARGGSKSIPLKNIKLLNGKPLIHWSLEELVKSVRVDKVVVATDSEDIIQSVQELNSAKIEIYQRSNENAQDTSSSESVMFEYISKSDLSGSDVFMLVQATSPFTKAEDFDGAIIKYKEGNYDSLLSAVVTKRFFWNRDGNPFNYDLMARPRRQDFKGMLMENGAFYINKVENIKKYGNRLSGKIGFYEMPEYTGLELDEPEDWIIAEYYMDKYHDIKKKTKFDVLLFITDVDGVLTDAGMYYTESGDELKKFNTHDGMGIQLLRENGIKTAIITSEKTCLVEKRAKKLKIDYLFQGINNKTDIAREICEKEKLSMNNIAYIGDDINDYDLLTTCGIAACPADAVEMIKSIPGIIHLKQKGGHGAVREFCEVILKEKRK